MLFTVDQFAVTTGQPVKLVFTNPDATDHNLVIVKPDALEEVGMAGERDGEGPAATRTPTSSRRRRRT